MELFCYLSDRQLTDYKIKLAGPARFIYRPVPATLITVNFKAENGS